MGGSRYSDSDYDARAKFRASTGSKTFDHDADIKAGKKPASVHASLCPSGVMRESRDSDAHPVALPIGITLDLTGSMGSVPLTIQARLPKLMGGFLNDKASGKRYIGDAYPAILISGVDDFEAMNGPEGTLQVGQFESGMEIDDNLTNLWITSRGGGTYEESYQLAMYFFARHTVHDHWEKRQRKGYLFVIGDEHAYRTIDKDEVKEVFGDTLQSDLATKDIIAELKQRYHVFFVIPNLTQHYNDPQLAKDWMELLGQQNVLLLDDPEKICELIVGAVAISEEHAGIDDLSSDLGFDSKALVPLAKAGVVHHSAEGLTPAGGHGIDRL